MVPRRKSAGKIETLIDSCTSASNVIIDPDDLQELCRMIDEANDGRCSFLQKIILKVQGPREPQEAILALEVLRYCARHCERAFQTEIGRFRFLNEIIKLFLPKYLGEFTDRKIKVKAAQLLYSWTKEIPCQPKIAEAYRLLVRNKFITSDEIIDRTTATASGTSSTQSQRASIFEDEARIKLLRSLLRSRNKDDVIKANMLIKKMAKEDEILLEKRSNRKMVLQTIRTNANVLAEILDNLDATSNPSSEAMITINLLHDQMLKHQTELTSMINTIQTFETDDLAEAIDTNEFVLRVIQRYKKIMQPNELENVSNDVNELIDLNHTLFSSAPQSLLLIEETEYPKNAQSTVDLLGHEMDNLALTERYSVTEHEKSLDDVKEKFDDIFELFSESTVLNVISTEESCDEKTHGEMLFERDGLVIKVIINRDRLLKCINLVIHISNSGTSDIDRLSITVKEPEKEIVDQIHLSQYETFENVVTISSIQDYTNTKFKIKYFVNGDEISDVRSVNVTPPCNR
ncbi:hypothetical protein ACOME3_008738 [Neoechinorhynchus agilis]